jgi:hypothetical protein
VGGYSGPSKKSMLVPSAQSMVGGEEQSLDEAEVPGKFSALDSATVFPTKPR